MKGRGLLPCPIDEPHSRREPGVLITDDADNRFGSRTIRITERDTAKGNIIRHVQFLQRLLDVDRVRFVAIQIDRFTLILPSAHIKEMALLSCGYPQCSQ